MAKKQINLIIQSKGGAGKSFLTYLLALKNENDDSTLFLDLDKSTATSTNQLEFINKLNRLSVVNITNHEQKIDREMLFQVLEEISETNFEKIFIDFGAPESEQLPLLFELDFSASEFKEFEKDINSEIIFNVVLAGGTNYIATMRYLEKIITLTEGKFIINAYLNIFTFNQTKELMLEAKQILSKLKINCIEFGNFFPDRNSGQELIMNMKNGLGYNSYTSFPTKTTIKKELNRI